MRTLFIVAQADVFNSFPILMVVVVTVGLFLLLREVMGWYWKLNKLVELQKHQTRILFKLYEQKGGSVNWDQIENILK